MSEQLFSPSWYRVAHLRPKIKDQAEVRRQDYRGQVWYVVYDSVTGKSHRLTIPAYTLLGLLDGVATVEEAWTAAADILGDELPTQGEVIQMLATLHRADVLSTDRSPDLDEMRERYESQQRSDRLKRFINPLALRFKLLDPDPLLRFLAPVSQVAFSRSAAAVWLLVVSLGLIALGTHWQEFTEGMSDQILSIDNLLIMLVVFPFIKAFHELGHGLAVKRWGGEVHDTGIMLLVFMPVPYVDASSSWAFREKYQRMIVGAGGMLFEVFLASIAMMVWTILEPGILRSLFYNTVFIAGFTTVLFNANPLLRFDGYYILMDWLEIPNLGTRANRFFLHQCKHYLFGMPHGDFDWGDVTERWWLFWYAIGAFVYRLLLTLTISLFVAGKFFVIGVLLASWAFTMSVLLPLYKLMRYLLWGAELRRYRTRALRVSGMITALIMALVFVIPLPYFAVAEGVVWIPENNHVRAGIGGFVSKVHALSGEYIKQGELLIELEDPELTNRKRILEYRLSGNEYNYRAVRVKDDIEAQLVSDEIEALKKDLADIARKIGQLNIVAPVSGKVVIAKETDLPGRFVGKGQLVGYVVDAAETTVRAAIEQQQVGLIRGRVKEIGARFSDELFKEYSATIVREVPGATDELPSLALTTQGGGKLANSPETQEEPKSYQRVFLFDLDVAGYVGQKWSGERVHIRFDLGYAPLWQQFYRRIRQIFLRLSDF